MSASDLADSLQHCRDSAGWTMADAMHWWEMEFDDSPAAAAETTDGPPAAREDSGTATH